MLWLGFVSLLWLFISHRRIRLSGFCLSSLAYYCLAQQLFSPFHKEQDGIFSYNRGDIALQILQLKTLWNLKTIALSYISFTSLLLFYLSGSLEIPVYSPLISINSGSTSTTVLLLWGKATLIFYRQASILKKDNQVSIISLTIVFILFLLWPFENSFMFSPSPHH